MAQRELDGTELHAPADVFEAFFAATVGLHPDYGGRNLDALNDDLRELREPLTLVIRNSRVARENLGEWFGRCVSTLTFREPGDQPVTVILE